VDAFVLPNTPSGNTNGLNYRDEKLCHEDKEESHEVERAVRPATQRQHRCTNTELHLSKH